MDFGANEYSRIESKASMQVVRSMNKLTSSAKFFFVVACMMPFLIAEISCVSPRQECEESEEPDQLGNMCMLMLNYYGDPVACRAREASGELRQGSCELQPALWECMWYAEAVSKCKKQSPLPIVPKIVLQLPKTKQHDLPVSILETRIDRHYPRIMLVDASRKTGEIVASTQLHRACGKQGSL